MKHTIDLGDVRMSGRTTIMLATLTGMQKAGFPALYIAMNTPQAALARSRSGHAIRCAGADAALSDLIRSAVAIGIDDALQWDALTRRRVMGWICDNPNLKLLMKAY